MWSLKKGTHMNDFRGQGAVVSPKFRRLCMLKTQLRVMHEGVNISYHFSLIYLEAP